MTESKEGHLIIIKRPILQEDITMHIPNKTVSQFLKEELIEPKGERDRLTNYSLKL